MMSFFTCIYVLLATLSGHADEHRMPMRKTRLVLHHMVGKDTLELGNNYVNALGDTISVYKFKYYLSNFSVTDETGKTTVLPESYFLVDEADPSSKFIELDLPDVALKQIHFMLGVDSAHNSSGIQEGALDPLRGMFWTWNNGYIMAKLEGRSPSSHIAMQSFTYHIGGYRTPMNTIRTVSLDLDRKLTHDIDIDADINRWFKNKSDLRISETPVCHSPGELAVRIADNYCNMFSLPGR